MDTETDLFTIDELPEEVRLVLDEAERSVTEVRSRSERQTTVLREEAERECAAIRARSEAEIAAVQQEATRQLAPLVRSLVERLRTLQESYTREGKLDEALAIRARVRQLRGDLLGVRPDPGTLTEFGQADFGRSFLFEVTGRNDGTIWGDAIYTADSRLAVAAVHAGIVRVGERGLIRVTILDGSTQAYEAVFRNDILSFDYANYPTAFRIERV